jgi:hypothetical protein
MLERLDDPTPPVPGASEFAAVRRRADALRGRRRTVVMICAIVLVAVAASTGLFASLNASNGLSAAQTVYDFNNLAGPLPVGTPVPTTALIDVVFADSQTGYAVAAQRGKALLAVTDDGGSSWTVQDSSLPGGFDQRDGFPGEIEFEGAHGYLWGGDVAADAAPLWVTFDAGRTWRQASIGDDVYDVSAIGSNVWAVAGCRQTSTSLCVLTVDQSINGGDTWLTTTGPVLYRSSATDAASSPVELARITSQRSYVLTSSVPPGSVPLLALSYTPDSGQSWVQRPVPCAAPYDLGAEVAASATDDLWLLCGSQGSGGSQAKELFRSESGGMNWSLTASDGGYTPPPSTPSTTLPVSSLTTPAQQAAATAQAAAVAAQERQADAAAGTAAAVNSHSLPLGGFIAPFSIGHRNLAVASPTTAWLKPTGASVFKTVDGGHTWLTVSDLNVAELESGGEGDITFVSATQGWVCAYGVGLWHTSDGVHWYPLGE